MSPSIDEFRRKDTRVDRLPLPDRDILRRAMSATRAAIKRQFGLRGRNSAPRHPLWSPIHPPWRLARCWNVGSCGDLL